MERADRELIMKFINSNVQLKRLYNEHLGFEQQLSKLSTRTFLTPSEEMRAKQLKKQKLIGVDKMMALIDGRRSDIVKGAQEAA